MRRTSLAEAPCPVARSLDAIGDWWSLLIVRDAFDGMTRFTEFQKSLGISKGILTGRLKQLVSLGILEMRPIAEDGAYQEYGLTRKGRDLFLVIVSLRQWGEDHCFNAGESHSVLLDSRTNRPVPRLELSSEDGGTLNSTTTHVSKL